MKAAKYLFFILLVSAASGQVSHAGLVKDLLGDFKKSLRDSMDLKEEVLLNFKTSGKLSEYLNQMEKYSIDEGRGDTIQITNTSLTLSINKNPDIASRNSSHVRKLDLDMTYELNGHSYKWHGGLSDRLSNQELSKLLDESFPVKMTGDFKHTQPSSIKVILISTLTLSLLAALYFIRT